MRGVAQLINTLFGVSICERSLCWQVRKSSGACRSAEDSSELQGSDKSTRSTLGTCARAAQLMHGMAGNPSNPACKGKVERACRRFEPEEAKDVVPRREFDCRKLRGPFKKSLVTRRSVLLVTVRVSRACETFELRQRSGPRVVVTESNLAGVRSRAFLNVVAAAQIPTYDLLARAVYKPYAQELRTCM